MGKVQRRCYLLPTKDIHTYVWNACSWTHVYHILRHVISMASICVVVAAYFHTLQGMKDHRWCTHVGSQTDSGVASTFTRQAHGRHHWRWLLECVFGCTASLWTPPYRNNFLQEHNGSVLAMSMLQLCNVTACSSCSREHFAVITFIADLYFTNTLRNRTIWIRCTRWSLTDATLTGVIWHPLACKCVDLVDSVISAYGKRWITTSFDNLFHVLLVQETITWHRW